MKKVSYIVALLVSLLYSFVALGAVLSSQAQTNVKTVGNLPTYVFVILSVVIAAATFIGSIGGLVNAKWGKKLTLGGYTLALLVNTTQGNPSNIIIALVVGLLVYFKG